MDGRVGPAGLATRDAVRRALADLADAAGSTGRTGPTSEAGPAAPVLVACSGGPDSLALASATAFVAQQLGVRAGAVVVDHQLQAGSAEVAAGAARTATELGLDPVEVLTVRVTATAGDGPEAAARAARYGALDAAAARRGAMAVLLGHTSDDQAESVLLGLLRGSGARSLSGMPARRGIYRRPFLRLSRETTAKACAELGLAPWADPHNVDPAYARARARRLVSDVAEQLGSGVRTGLARSAELLRADDEALETWAAREYDALLLPGDAPGLDCAALAGLPAAVRLRVLRRAALAAGARPPDLSSTHLAALDALVTAWHGQGPVDLPGPLHGVRDCGRLLIAPDINRDTAAPDIAEE
ncbi:MAG: tRNA lysidine(34) synthetase TilS [Actinomycetales bacterium]